MKTVLIIAALMLAPLQIPSQQPAGLVTGSVSAVVRNAETNAPIAGVEVRLMRETVEFNREALLEKPLTAKSDEMGRVVFQTVSVGKYSLWLEPPGYVWVDHAGRIPVVVEQGLRGDDVTLRLSPTGTINGRVLGTNGEPLIGATIEEAVVTYRDGVRTLGSIGGGVTTDLQGNYRLSGLAPGKYYLRTEYHPSTAPKPPLVYFPGTLDEQQATPVVVRPGADVEGINFSLVQPLPVATFSISGAVAGLPASAAEKPVGWIALSARDGKRRGESDTYSNVAGDTSSGRFQIRGVVPGTYDLWTRIRDDAGVSYTALATVDVASSVAGVSVPVVPVVEVHGRIVVNGKPPEETNDRYVGLWSLTGIDGTPPDFWEYQPVFANKMLNSRTGEFTIPRLPSGRYKLALSSTSPDGYVADIRQNGRSIVDGFAATADAAPIEVVVTSPGGTVDGLALGAKLEPAPGATVVLVSDTNLGAERQWYPTLSDNSGRFTIRRLPPAQYRIYAWTTLPQGDPWKNAVFMRRYEALGQVVVVTEGKTTTVRLPALVGEE